MKNENGYALPTVLLTMVIFTVLALAFFSQSQNSTKQNREMEEKAQSVALAEMGVEYYYQAVSNAYKKSQSELAACVESKVREDEENDNLQTPEYYQKECMIEGIDKALSSVKLDPLAEDNHLKENTDFYITRSNITDGGDRIEITYRSIGEKSDEKTELDATLTMNLGVDGDGTGTGSSTLPQFNEIKKPENVKVSCKNTFNVNCDSILFEGSGSVNENLNSLNSKTIYSMGAIEIYGNMNSAKNMKIHSEGSITIGKNMNGVDNSIIEAKGAANFGGHFRLSSSKLLVAGSFMVTDHFDVKNGSFTFIGGDAHIGKHLTIDSSSKVCVAGDLKVDGNLDNNGQLYIKNHDPVSFEQNCGSTSNSINWDENIEREITYN